MNTLVNNKVNNNEEYKLIADIIVDLSTDIITDLGIIQTWNNEDWNIYKQFMLKRLKTNNIKLCKEYIQYIEEDFTELKEAMYKLLKELNGIQEQFKQADLKQGQKVTIFRINDFGMMSTNQVTIDRVEYTKFAQYDNAVKLIFQPKNQRNLYYNHYYNDVLVYDGWLELPKEVLFNTRIDNGMIINSSKYLSCDKRQYDEIINYFQSQNILPIINTYKPIF